MTRKFDPDADLKDIPTGPGRLLVTVIGRSVSTTRESRPGSVRDTFTVDVAIRAKVPQSLPDDACDDLSGAAPQGQRLLVGNQAVDGTAFIGVEKPPWSVSHLTDQRVVVSMMTFPSSDPDYPGEGGVMLKLKIADAKRMFFGRAAVSGAVDKASLRVCRSSGVRADDSGSIRPKARQIRGLTEQLFAYRPVAIRRSKPKPAATAAVIKAGQPPRSHLGFAGLHFLRVRPVSRWCRDWSGEA